VELAHDLTLFQLLLVGIYGIANVAWVPIDDLHFWHLLRLMMLLEFLFHVLLGKLIKPNNLFHKGLIIKLITERLVIRETGINSEHNRQFVLHCGPKYFELFFRKMKLKLVILSENIIILGNRVNGPLLVYFLMPFVLFVKAIG
jgi:hypothetical protein